MELKKIYKQALKDNRKLLPAEGGSDGKISKTESNLKTFGNPLIDLYNKATDFNVKFPPGTFFPPKYIIDKV